MTTARVVLHGPAYQSADQLPVGHLTDEHAMSSYGLPVLVVDDQALGAGDLPPGTWLNYWPTDIMDDPTLAIYEEERDLINAGRAAGYTIQQAFAV